MILLKKYKERKNMGNKIFNKKLPKRCEYCIHGTKSQFTNEVLCLKKGIMDANDMCRKYKYDPLKRTPQLQKPFDNYTAEDFKI